ncbi:hypothetical protein SDC9_152469 [bioreactor metagenome]|uniref:Uncharacterized protein n=1 Tax=bioreactor metagenome TaxID=1076179 RepID=A0A645EVI1_9ZZZZ
MDKRWLPTNERDTVRKGILFAVSGRGISKKDLDTYCELYAWDKRYKIQIVAGGTWTEKIKCSGICKYKDKVYRFIYRPTDPRFTLDVIEY